MEEVNVNPRCIQHLQAFFNVSLNAGSVHALFARFLRRKCAFGDQRDLLPVFPCFHPRANYLLAVAILRLRRSVSKNCGTVNSGRVDPVSSKLRIRIQILRRHSGGNLAAEPHRAQRNRRHLERLPIEQNLCKAHAYTSIPSISFSSGLSAKCLRITSGSVADVLVIVTPSRARCSDTKNSSLVSSP